MLHTLLPVCLCVYISLQMLHTFGQRISMDSDEIHWNIQFQRRDEDEYPPNYDHDEQPPQPEAGSNVRDLPATTSSSPSLPTSAATSESNSYSDIALFNLLSSPPPPPPPLHSDQPLAAETTTDIVSTLPESERSRRKSGDQSEQRRTQSQENKGGVESKRNGDGLRPERRRRSTEVHIISERRRRERMREKIKTLQELIPGCQTAHRGAVLDAAVKYIKALKRQIEAMSQGEGGLHLIPYMPQLPIVTPPVPMRPFMGFGMGMHSIVPSITSTSPLFPSPLSPSSVYYPIYWGSGGGGEGSSTFYYPAAGESSSGNEPRVPASELHHIPAIVQRPTPRRTSITTVHASQLIRPSSFHSSQSAETPPLLDEETLLLMRRIRGE